MLFVTHLFTIYFFFINRQIKVFIHLKQVFILSYIFFSDDYNFINYRLIIQFFDYHNIKKKQFKNHYFFISNY